MTISLIKQQQLSCNIYQENDGVIVYQIVPKPRPPRWDIRGNQLYLIREKRGTDSLGVHW